MNDFVALEILNTHGEMLARGQADATQVMCQQYPELATYFQIAQGLSEVLKMVPVSAEFVSNLQATLLHYPPSDPDLWIGETRRGWVLGGVAFGSAVTGLAAYAFHRLRTPDVPAAAPAA
jgi:hypothetical protein